MNLKFLLYPAVIVAVVFLSLFVILQRWQIVISLEPLEPLEPQAASLHEPEPIATPATNFKSDAAPNPAPVTNLTAVVKTQPKQTPLATPPGVLRLSNQTEHPVRVAFLARQDKPHSSNQSARNSNSAGKVLLPQLYGEPAHWDFEPGEGSSNGLILSLPAGFVRLEKGDILVAFAQDGSRLYWGPFVVGETPQPVWNQQKSEWLLTLQP